MGERNPRRTAKATFKEDGNTLLVPGTIRAAVATRLVSTRTASTWA